MARGLSSRNAAPVSSRPRVYCGASNLERRMRTTKAWLALGALAVGALHVEAALAQRSTSFSASALTAPPTDGWRTNGGNLFNQRYSPLNLIDRGNVAQLKG